MRTPRAALVLLLAALSAAPPALAMDAAQLYERRAPAVWLVRVSDALGRAIGTGSAVVTAPGELVTNCHVLRGGKSVAIKHERTTLQATLAYADPERDLCLLHAEGLVSVAVPVAATDTLRVGQHVYAIGAPRGIELTLSDGLIAALHRNARGEVVSIQVTVPLSPGSSGGGLFDSEGRLIGIPFLTLRDAQNLNFAIPAVWIRDVPARGEAALQAYHSRQGKAASASSAAAAAAASATLSTSTP